MENCLFCKFVSGEFNVNKVFENEDMIIIRDIAPMAKNHFLAIPKVHFKYLAEMTNEDGISGIDIDYKTIGQYTGLTDANGNKIFEGDILRGTFYGFLSPTTETFAVYWDKKTSGFQTNYFEPKECEIVGNIYDNPELL